MGYDFQMRGYGKKTQVYCTYNVSPMFYAANPGKGINVINGMSGGRAVIKLKHIYNHLVQNKAAMEALNPVNGYGSYDDTVHRVLDRLIAISKAHPEGIWEVT